jgi:hypothetical protein
MLRRTGPDPPRTEILIDASSPAPGSYRLSVKFTEPSGAGDPEPAGLELRKPGNRLGSRAAGREAPRWARSAPWPEAQ